MPPLYIVVGPDRLLEDTPIFWGEDGALNPLLLDVVSRIAEGLGLCLNAKAYEHRSDLVVREEREGHEFPDELVRYFIVTVCSLGAKLLPLGRQKVKICDFKENVRLTNGVLKVMLHGLTVCPNTLTVDAYVLTVVYICFIKKG